MTASAPLTPPYVRVSYTAVRYISVYTLFSPHAPLFSFTSGLHIASSMYWNNVTFSPSLSRESSPGYRGSLPTGTMASADFSWLNAWVGRSPLVRAFSFLRCLPDLLFRFIELRTLACCAALSNLIASYQIPVRQYRILQSGFVTPFGRELRFAPVHCTPHGEPAFG